jgi:hypothetical protein
MKKRLCLYLFILSSLSANSIAQDVWDGGIDENWPEDITQDELTISTPAQLARLARLVNDSLFSFEGKQIRLVNDINLNHLLWEPVGRIEPTEAGSYGKRTPFRGHFNGNNKKIRNLRIAATYPAAGLFGYIENGAKIENLTLTNGRINVNNSMTKAGASESLQTTGALAGRITCEARDDSVKTDSVIIRNCHNINVAINNESGNSYSAGLVGYIDHSVTHPVKKDIYESFFLLENCSNAGEISGTGDVAGLVAHIRMADTTRQRKGNHERSVLIKNCLNRGFLSGTSEDAGIGGIVGYAGLKPPREYDNDSISRYHSLIIESCVNYGDMENPARACIGGIAGSIRCSDVSGGNEVNTLFRLSDCYSACTVYASDGKTGGLIGEIRSHRAPSPFSPVKIIVENNYVTGYLDIAGDATAGGLAGDVFLDESDGGETLWEGSHFGITGSPADCRIRNNLVALAGMNAPYTNTFRIAGRLKATGLEKPLFSENYAYIEGSTRATEAGHYKPDGEDWKGTMLSAPLSDWNDEREINWDFDPANRFMPKLANVSFEQPDIPNPMYGKENAGMAPVPERPFSCSSSGYGLYIDAAMPGDLSVYKFSGSLYTRRFIPAGTTTIQMPKDFYIVNFNGFSEKVIINK